MDITGRSRIVTNVLSSWFGYLVFVLAGFIMPRVIDGYLGRFSLGIWDLAWSLVNYLSLSSLGIGSSVNRYVALYRSRGDTAGIRRATASVFYVQAVIAAGVIVAAAIMAGMLPTIFPDQEQHVLADARWVVILLGTGLAIQIFLDIHRGVITGFHRWDIHNNINAISYIATVGIMILGLVMGGGLPALAALYLSGVLLTEIVRARIARTLFPDLNLRYSLFDRDQAKEMFGFGIKTLMSSLPQLLVIQTNNILAAAMLGPAALAILARPIALVRHLEAFLNKFSFVLTPTASAIQGMGNLSEVRSFLLRTTRYGVAITLPIIILLSFYGDLILDTWMGPEYAHGEILAILAVGYFLPVSQSPAIKILTGLNLHGKAGLLSLITAMIVYGAGLAAVHETGWSLINAAFLVAAALSLGPGIVIPVIACRKLHIPPALYLRRAFLSPLICAAPYLTTISACRLTFPDNPWMDFVAGNTIGGLITVAVYWRYIFSHKLRSELAGLFYRYSGMNAENK